MASEDIVTGAFSEEHAEQLSGVSAAQLRRWDKLGFFVPSYADENRRMPYSRIYSFRDLVSLRVLNDLRNNHGCSLQHLREVAQKLAGLRQDGWGSTNLYVFNKRVVVDEPGARSRREVVSGQYVVDIPLKVAISNTRRAVAALNKRGADEIGHVEQGRFLAHNAPVMAGTRVSVRAIKRFTEAGYSPAQIVKEYPNLTPKDVRAALAYEGADAAA